MENLKQIKGVRISKQMLAGLLCVCLLIGTLYVSSIFTGDTYAAPADEPGTMAYLNARWEEAKIQAGWKTSANDSRITNPGPWDMTKTGLSTWDGTSSVMYSNHTFISCKINIIF